MRSAMSLPRSFAARCRERTSSFADVQSPPKRCAFASRSSASVMGPRADIRLWAPPPARPRTFGHHAKPRSDPRTFGHHANPRTDARTFGHHANPRSDPRTFGHHANPRPDPRTFGHRAGPVSNTQTFGQVAPSPRCFRSSCLHALFLRWRPAEAGAGESSSDQHQTRNRATSRSTPSAPKHAARRLYW